MVLVMNGLIRGAVKAVKPSSRSEIERDHKEAAKKLNDLERLLSSAREEFPHLEAVLGRMVELASDVRME